MNPLLVVAALLLGVLRPMIGTAQTLTPISECNPAIVFYGNGVNNSLDEAQESAETLEIRLRSRLDQTGSSDRGLAFALSLNPTDGFIDDVLQSAAQLGIPLTARGIWELLTETTLPPSLRPVKELAYSTILQKAMLIDGSRLNLHAGTYTQYVQRGHRVAVVAHSQGNLHVNQVLRVFLLSNDVRQHFSTMAVATPDSVVDLSKRAHVTILKDYVVSLAPAPLPKNTDSPPVDFMGHSFVDTYLKQGSLAEGLILGGVLGTIRELPPPLVVPTSTFISPPGAPIVANRPVTFTATVTANCPPPPVLPPPPTAGTVTFIETLDGTILCAAVPVAAGQATCATSFPYAEAYNVVARYSGDVQAGLGASSASADIDVFAGPVDFTTRPRELFEGGSYEFFAVISGPPGPYDCAWSSPVWGANPLVFPNCLNGQRGPWGGGLGPAGTTMINLTLSLSSTGQVIDSVTRPVVTHHAPGFDSGTVDYDYQCVDRLWVDLNGYLNHHYVVDITSKAYLPTGGSAVGIFAANITSCGGWRVEVLNGKTVCHRDAGLPVSAVLKVHDEQRFYSGQLVTSVMFGLRQRDIIQDGVTNVCRVIPPA